MPKHYRPPGKKKEGNSAKFITRSKALRYLQTNLTNFRKLCIFKGVFPRDPKKKFEGTDKTYYHMKDIQFIAHESLLNKFRDRRAYDKKIKKALGKKNAKAADRLLSRKPTYKLDRLVRERYPTFIDALRDLDDMLTLVHLFASLPAVEGLRLDVKRIHACRRLCHEWQAYVCRTHKLRKVFISVKGIYYQAEVEGQKITWLTPHALQQVLPADANFSILLDFLEFAETVLAFINFKLYHSIQVQYPPILDPRLEALAADLYALSRHLTSGVGTPSQNVPSVTMGGDTEMKDDSQKMESELRMAQLQHQLPGNETGALMRLANDAYGEDNDDDETKECKNLFKDLKFFLSREVPRESLLFIIPSFGGTVSWDGEGSPFKETDEGITHQIVDRPTQGHMFLSREYVQPQWLFDCVNARILLPTEQYMVGRVPPPHLSPFVDNEAEGYVPEYAETIKRLQAAAKKLILPMPGLENESTGQDNILAEGVLDRNEAKEVAEKQHKLMMLEKQHREELDMEVQGISYSTSVSNKKLEIASQSAEGGKDTTPDAQVDDDQDISAVVMTRKKRKLLEAMKIGKARKKANVDLLEERKRKAALAGRKSTSK